MIKKQKIVLWVLGFLIVGAILDMVSTYWNKNFLLLEMNPLYMLLPSIWTLIITKVVITALLVIIMLKIDNMKPFNQYTLIFIVLVCIGMQFGAAFSNYMTGKALAKIEGYENSADIPKEAIQNYVQPPKETLIDYFTGTLIWVMIPTIVAFFSFVLWENMYYKLGDEKNEKSKESNAPIVNSGIDNDHDPYNRML